MAIILFIVKEKVGTWFAIGWMAMWFGIQFICHEWYTILHILILYALVSTIIYAVKTKKKFKKQ